MIIAGITGGIGSGKTTIAKLFQLLGVPVYYADTAAKQLMEENNEVKKEILHLFGASSYINNQLNSTFLSSEVFNNPEKLNLLNAIVHPATIQAAKEWISKQSAPYVLKEAALFFESGSGKEIDFMIGVYAPAPLRMKRVMDRNHLSAEQVKKRMENQIDETIKMRLCDAVIENDDRQLVIPQVLRIHQQLLLMADLNKPQA